MLEMIKFQGDLQGGKRDQNDRGKEMHALSCASKSLSTWTAQHCAQECREACGGHGYLQSSRLGQIRYIIAHYGGVQSH